MKKNLTFGQELWYTISEGWGLTSSKKPEWEYIMCRLRLFYECSDGTMGFAEHVMRYEDDIASFIKHWKTGGRMVITEHIDLV